MKTNLKQKMRTKLMVSMIAFMAVMVSLSGCKDDDDKKPSNSFTIDGSKKSLKSAFFRFDTESGDSDTPGEELYGHRLLLTSDGIELVDGNVSGSGNMIFLAFIGTSMNLQEGTYEFTGDEAGAGAFEIWEAFVYLGISIAGEKIDIDEEYTFTAGKMTVSKAKDAYTIKVEGTVDGKAMSGTYTGTLTSIPREN